MRIRLQGITVFLRTNIDLKILALLLATLSFYAIRGVNSLEISYDVPLEIEVEKGIAILEKDASLVNVMFRGSQEDMRNLEQRRLRAVVRPRAVDPTGRERVPIERRAIEGAAGVRVVRVRPTMVNLTFDREDERRVAVHRPRTVGTPLVGRVELDYEPRFVLMRGPRLRLMDLQSVSTEPVDVDGRVESFTKKVRVLPPGERWVSQIVPEEISVTVNIVATTGTRTYEGISVLALGLPDAAAEVRFEPRKVDVEVEGRTEQFEHLEARDIKAFADCTGLKAGTVHVLPVRVYVPPKVSGTVTARPDTVEAVLK